MIFQLVLVLVGLLTYFYYKTWKKMTLWSSMGLDEDPGSFPFGSEPNRDLLMQKHSFNAMFDKSYQTFKGKKFWGSYGTLGAPQFVVNDVELMKDILIKDFDYFPSQRDLFMGTNKYMADMMIAQSGDRWKAMRTLATPVFTSGKLKSMVPLIDRVGDAFVKHLESYATDNKEFECKDLFTKYSVEVVAAIGFGIDGKVFSDPNSVFKDQVDKMMYRGKHKPGAFTQATQILAFVWPALARLLRLEVFDPAAVNFLTDIIKRQISDRQKTGNKGNDFIGAMMQGYAQLEKEGGDGKKIFKDQEDLETAIIANIIVLFFGGFDTSSTTASTTVWFLAKNPEVQEAMYEEIKEAIEANGGSQHLDYDTVQNMPYLEGVLNEDFRMYPLGHLERTCAKEYQIKGTNVTIKPGTLVQIPTVSMMRDSDYFEDPDTFDPTRWGKDDSARANPNLIHTFGHGPRACIGKRFALLQNKMALMRLVANYKIVPCERTCKELVTDPASTSLDVLGGVWLKCVKRN